MGGSRWQAALRKLGLERPEARAWAMYDWANSAVFTTIITAVFPIYFARVAAAGLDPTDAVRRYGKAPTLALVITALMAPFLGALGDVWGKRKLLLLAFAGVGIAATGCMVLVEQGDWELALVLFVVTNVGAAGSLSFYDA